MRCAPEDCAWNMHVAGVAWPRCRKAKAADELRACRCVTYGGAAHTIRDSCWRACRTECLPACQCHDLNKMHTHANFHILLVSCSRHVLQEWPGNQVFLADGRIVLNNKWYGVLGTILLLFALEGVFLGIVAWRLKPVGRVLAYIAGCDIRLMHSSCT